MSEKKELNNEELEKVSGGKKDDSLLELEKTYTYKISKSEVATNLSKDILFVKTILGEYRTDYKWILATVNSVFEDPQSCNRTVTTANLTIIKTNDGLYNVGQNYDVPITNYEAYLKG